MFRTPLPCRLPFALAATLLVASCAITAPAPAAGPTRIQGTIASIDLQPWTYDGHAVVEVDADGGGRVPVALPARWNLCRAAAVDVEALAVGMRVDVVGEASGEGGVVVCTDPAHRLTPAAGVGSKR